MRWAGLVAAGAGLDAPLEGFAAWVPTLDSELPYMYPARRVPRRFLVVRAARERCGACLCTPVAVARREAEGCKPALSRSRGALRRSLRACATCGAGFAAVVARRRAARTVRA
jgi:hypothetical protein